MTRLTAPWALTLVLGSGLIAGAAYGQTDAGPHDEIDDSVDAGPEPQEPKKPPTWNVSFDERLTPTLSLRGEDPCQAFFVYRGGRGAPVDLGRHTTDTALQHRMRIGELFLLVNGAAEIHCDGRTAQRGAVTMEDVKSLKPSLSPLRTTDLQTTYRWSLIQDLSEVSDPLRQGLNRFLNVEKWTCKQGAKGACEATSHPDGIHVGLKVPPESPTPVTLTASDLKIELIVEPGSLCELAPEDPSTVLVAGAARQLLHFKGPDHCVKSLEALLRRPLELFDEKTRVPVRGRIVHGTAIELDVRDVPADLAEGKRDWWLRDGAGYRLARVQLTTGAPPTVRPKIEVRYDTPYLHQRYGGLVSGDPGLPTAVVNLALGRLDNESADGQCNAAAPLLTNEASVALPLELRDLNWSIEARSWQSDVKFIDPGEEGCLASAREVEVDPRRIRFAVGAGQAAPFSVTLRGYMEPLPGPAKEGAAPATGSVSPPTREATSESRASPQAPRVVLRLDLASAARLESVPVRLSPLLVVVCGEAKPTALPLAGTSRRCRQASTPQEYWRTPASEHSDLDYAAHDRTCAAEEEHLKEGACRLMVRSHSEVRDHVATSAGLNENDLWELGAGGHQRKVTEAQLIALREMAVCFERSTRLQPGVVFGLGYTELRELSSLREEEFETLLELFEANMSELLSGWTAAGFKANDCQTRHPPASKATPPTTTVEGEAPEGQAGLERGERDGAPPAPLTPPTKLDHTMTDLLQNLLFLPHATFKKAKDDPQRYLAEAKRLRDEAFERARSRRAYYVGRGGDALVALHGPQAVEVVTSEAGGQQHATGVWLIERLDGGASWPLSFRSNGSGASEEVHLVKASRTAAPGVVYREPANGSSADAADAWAFQARLRSRGSFGWQGFPARLYLTVPVGLLAVRMPANPRELSSSREYTFAQPVFLKTGIAAVLEPWNYHTGKNAWSIPLRAVVGWHLLEITSSPNYFAPALIGGISASVPFLSDELTGSFIGTTQLSVGVFAEQDLRPLAPFGKDPARSWEPPRLLLTFGVDIGTLLGPKNAQD